MNVAALDLEEQEQLSELKVWWQRYGNLITGIVMAVALAVVGWRGWNWYQSTQSAQAVGVFAAVQKAVGEKNTKQVRDLTGELIDKYPQTTQATLAVLLAAKAQVEAGDAKSAKAQLTWATEHAKDEGLKDLARLRLAGLLLDEKAYDAALNQVDQSSQPSFAPRFAELKGDILLAQGKRADAKAAYKAALDKQQAGAKDDLPAPIIQRDALYKEMLTAKLESLGDAL